MVKLKTKSEKPKPEVKTKNTPISVGMVMIEPGKMTEYDLSLTDVKEVKIDHNGKSLEFKRDDVLQKTFAKMNWHGGVKQLYAFCRLPREGTPELIGLDEFNPYKTISAEEADIMLHEDVTLRGVKHLVTKIAGRGGLPRGWLLFAVILIVIIAIVMKSQGMIG